MKIGDLVYLKWEDSRGSPGGWVDIAHARTPQLATIQTVGWVMALSKAAVSVAPSIATIEGDGESTQGNLVIPLSGLLTSKRIKLPPNLGILTRATPKV